MLQGIDYTQFPGDFRKRPEQGTAKARGQIPVWEENTFLFGLCLLFESSVSQQGTPSTLYRQERNCGPETLTRL